MLNFSVSPFASNAVGVKAYADPTLIDVIGRPEIVGAVGAPAPGVPVGVGGVSDVVTGAEGAASVDP
jgi:hypothetical protein